MSNDIRVSDPNGNFIFDALSFKKDTAPVQNNNTTTLPEQNLNQNNNTVQNDEHLSGLNQNSGRIPSNSVTFSENPDDLLPPLATMERGQVNNNSNDPNDLPFLDFNVPQNNEQLTEEPTNQKNHSTGKMVVHLEAHLLKSGINKLATSIISKNAAKAVTKELTEVLAKTAVKSSAKQEQQWLLK